jgi:AAA+ ATPase superfamily predicted ATPase
VFQLCSDLGFTSPEDILTLYGIFGGMPRYYEIIENMGLGGKSVREILQKALFSSFAPFRHEVHEIILSEFGGNSYTYIAILEAIATGKTRLSEIAGSAGITATSLSKYMRKLSDMFDLVKREVPITEKSWRSKKGHYTICDRFIAFWMRFIYRQLSIYEAGNYPYFLERLDTYVAEFMGLAFEEIIKELLQTLNRQGKAPIVFHTVGRWWNRREEIDLVALNQDTGDTLFVECKWTTSSVDAETLHALKRKSESLPTLPQQSFYLLASKSGFSSRLRQTQDTHTFLWDLSSITDLVHEI